MKKCVPPSMSKTSCLVKILEGGHASGRTNHGSRTSAAANGSIGNFGLNTEEDAFAFSVVVRRDEEAMCGGSGGGEGQGEHKLERPASDDGERVKEGED